MSQQGKFYSLGEELVNIITHGVGALLSVAALVLMVVWSSFYGNAWHIVGSAIFGVSLIILYTASTLYHAVQQPQVRARLRVLDHAAIYVLIAGTYTPFTLVTLNGTVGWTIFGITWGLAVIGVVLKLFFTGKFDKLSTAMYVGMGWVVVGAAKPLMENLEFGGLMWLLWGGIAYTVGAIFYSIKAIPFGHAIFHSFVLVGSFCHFAAVFWYVIP